MRSLFSPTPTPHGRNLPMVSTLPKSKRELITAIILVILPFIFFTVSLSYGAFKTSLADLLEACKLMLGLTSSASSMHTTIILNARLPRLLAAILVGAGLSVSGAVFQGLFKNPLASPYTLGVSNGAGFGAALGLLLGLPLSTVQLSAVLFGIFSVSITYLLGSRSKGSTASLILAGMLVGSLFASLVSLIKFVADPYEKLPQIEYWLMGSLASVRLGDVLTLLPIYLIALCLLFAYRWRINILSLGDTEARSFGLNVQRDRAIIISCASMLTALVVSISGVIGWVGIVIPHLARMLVGPDFRKLIPASLSLGICYLILIDDLCRTLSATEIPIGVITGIIGAPLFIYFIYKKRVNW